jgi:hypothetical protein
MQVKAAEFTALKGHVADGCQIIAPNGKQFALKNTMKGWTITDAEGSPVSGNLPSALDVEFFVVNGIGVNYE